jgi:signal transduction histidine kinase
MAAQRAENEITMIRNRGFIVATFAIAIFAVMLVYAFLQLYAVHRTLSSTTGENMLWNVAQADRAARKLTEVLLTAPGKPDEALLSLQFDILFSRVHLLNDNPQYSFYVGIDGQKHLEQIDRILATAQQAFERVPLDANVLYGLISPIFDELDRLSNKTVIELPRQSGKKIDRQLETISLVMTSILGLLASGGALSWLLVANIRNLNKTQSELMVHKEQLEDTVSVRTTALRVALDNERQTIAIYKNFLTTVSHQFRTPIAVIDMIAQRFVKWPEDVTRAVLVERSQRIRTAVKRLGLIIESTINNDRMTEGGLELLVTRVNFVEIVQNACSYHSDIYPSRLLNVTLGSGPMYIEGDATLLEQIVVNLLSNAEKYSSASTPVDVWVRISGEQIVCSVTDFGIGIPEWDLPKIYDRFFRASNVSHLEGSGLGLSLSHTLARLHGGTIHCRTSKRETTFELKLPMGGLGNG